MKIRISPFDELQYTYRKKPWVPYLIGFAILLGIVIVRVVVNSLLNTTMVGSVVAILIGIGLYILYVFWYLSRRSTGWGTMLFSVLVVIEFLSLWRIQSMRIDEENARSHGMKDDITYVTYAESCPYCQASSFNMRTAVALYNETHLDKVILVDIDHDTLLEEDISPLVDTKGTVIRKKGRTVKQLTYPSADQKGNPIPSSVESIYQKLKEMEN